MALAHRITHPLARPDGVHFELADIGVRVSSMSERSPGVLEQVIASWLRADAIVYCDPAVGVPDLFRHEPRVRTAPTGPENPAEQHRISVDLAGPWALSDPAAFHRATQDTRVGMGWRVDAAGVASISVRTARARALASEPRAIEHPVGIEWVDGPVRLERYFAGW